MGNCNRRRSARRLRRLRTERYFRVRAHRAFPRVCMVLSMRSIFSSPVISGRALSNGPSNPICTMVNARGGRAGARRDRRRREARLAKQRSARSFIRI